MLDALESAKFQFTSNYWGTFLGLLSVLQVCWSTGYQESCICTYTRSHTPPINLWVVPVMMPSCS